MTVDTCVTVIGALIVGASWIDLRKNHWQDTSTPLSFWTLLVGVAVYVFGFANWLSLWVSRP